MTGPIAVLWFVVPADLAQGKKTWLRKATLYGVTKGTGIPLWTAQEVNA